jgi:hypothetical protein
MVTPVHDPEWRKWSVRPDGTMTGIDDAFADYKAHQFQDYLDRGWCRLEMFFNAYMPFRTARAKLFGGRLEQIMSEESRRPHLVFGTRELERREMPVILRALREDEIEAWKPENGSLHPDSRPELQKHMKELFETSQILKVHMATFLYEFVYACWELMIADCACLLTQVCRMDWVSCLSQVVILEMCNLLAHGCVKVLISWL